MGEPKLVGITDAKDMNPSRYDKTYLGKLNGPEGENVVVMRFVDLEGDQHMILVSVQDSKQLMFDILRTLQATGDPISAELLKSFQSVFAAKAQPNTNQAQ